MPYRCQPQRPRSCTVVKRPGRITRTAIGSMFSFCGCLHLSPPRALVNTPFPCVSLADFSRAAAAEFSRGCKPTEEGTNINSYSERPLGKRKIKGRLKTAGLRPRLNYVAAARLDFTMESLRLQRMKEVT